MLRSLKQKYRSVLNIKNKSKMATRKKAAKPSAKKAVKKVAAKAVRKPRAARKEKAVATVVNSEDIMYHYNGASVKLVLGNRSNPADKWELVSNPEQTFDSIVSFKKFITLSGNRAATPAIVKKMEEVIAIKPTKFYDTALGSWSPVVQPGKTFYIATAADAGIEHDDLAAVIDNVIYVGITALPNGIVPATAANKKLVAKYLVAHTNVVKAADASKELYNLLEADFLTT